MSMKAWSTLSFVSALVYSKNTPNSLANRFPSAVVTTC